MIRKAHGLKSLQLFLSEKNLPRRAEVDQCRFLSLANFTDSWNSHPTRHRPKTNPTHEKADIFFMRVDIPRC